ncbi:MAG TPA: ABC transporter permease, partial [Candidatus Saccharimonadales bacterium]|nr:ABC transporter permease [Candidatus Saccharimonadales bacterium]
MLSGNYKTALHSLRQSRWRTFFTMLGIIIGITSVVTVVSLGNGLKSQISGQINQLGSDVITVRPGKLISQNGGTSSLNLYAFLAPSTLTSKDIETLRDLPAVDSVTPIEYLTNSAKGDKGEFDDVFVAATTPNFIDTVHQKVNFGSFFTDDSEDTNTAVIGNDVASRLFGELNPVGESITIMGQQFIVRGVLASTQGGLVSIAQADYNSSIFIPVAAADSLTSDHTSILQILARVKKGTNIDQDATTITNALAKNHGGSGDFTVLKQSQLLGVTSQVISTVTNFISAVAAISLIVGGIGIMNIMLVSVSERSREIVIRKAIG